MRFRRLAGMALLLACMAAYWLHFEQRFAELEAETALKDPAGQLSAPDRERLLALRAALQRDFGVTARLVVRMPDAVPPTAVPGNILYMAVTPQTGGAVVLLPSLLARALTTADGPDPERRLADQLNACARRTTVGTCLQNALLDMLVALGEPGAELANSEKSESGPPAERLQSPSVSQTSGAIRGPLRTVPPTDTLAPPPHTADSSD